MIDRYVLPGDAVFPEGITEGPGDDDFFVSSARNGAVYRGTLGEPDLAVWQPPGADGRTQALGMEVDGYGRLLVCGGGDGTVYAYDLAGGLAQTVQVPATRAYLNDVVITGGHAYVTDSLRPVVWRVPVGEKLGPAEEWLDLTAHGADPEELHFLNGVVAALDGAALLVAAQGTGVIWRAETADASIAPVDLGGVRVNGDGMVFVDDLLYVCDNTDEEDGSVRYWLTALTLAGDLRSGALAGRWETSEADTPTTLAYRGGRLLVVNSQFGAERTHSAAPPFTVSARTPPRPEE